MIEKISGWFVNWQIEKHMLAKEDYAVYQYAYEVMINQILNIIIAVLIAVIWRAPAPVFFFLVSYIPLRSYCGGYHAKSNGGCMAVSAVLINIVCLLVLKLPALLAKVIQPVSFIISFFVIFRYAPVEDCNKRLDEKEVCQYKKCSRITWLIEVLAYLAVVFFWKNVQVSLTIAISHLFMSIMLCAGIFKNFKNRT